MTISTQASVIYRNKPVDFVATVSDDKDGPSTLQVRWSAMYPTNQSCAGIGASDWPYGISPSPADVPFTFKATSLSFTCLCAQVTDSQGASGYACYGPFKAQTPPPDAKITDLSGATSGQPRRLCSQISLSAKDSSFPPGDPVQYTWGVQYSGSDPAAGKSAQLVPCSGDSTNVSRCLDAQAAGTYTVSLTIEDDVDPTAPQPGTAPAFVIPVLADQPPCLVRSDPDVHAGRILLARSTDLGGSYQNRTFKALTVDDDCEPYPKVAGSTGSTQFQWSIYDPTSSANPQWVPQTDTSDTLIVSQTMFPNARPGDTIKVRLEVRDAQVQYLYQTGVYSAAHPICTDTTDVCCGSDGCTSANACVRWTTWTVQFQP